MPVTGAADAVPERIAGVVYIDALVPRDGQAAIDLLPGTFAADVRTRISQLGDGWRVPVPEAVLPPKAGLQPQQRADYVSRLLGQSAATFAEAIRLKGRVDRLPHAFIRCTRSALPNDPIEAMADRARREEWVYREINAPHDPHLFNAAETARVLLDVSAELSRLERT